jgi:hypothetical protein
MKVTMKVTLTTIVAIKDNIKMILVVSDNPEKQSMSTP